MHCTSSTRNNKLYVVVARHGERWDYLQKDAGKGEEWIRQADRPWDPPLSPRGLQQASRLGHHLSKKLFELKLPDVACVYSSPFLRCRQTACQAIEALNNGDDNDATITTTTDIIPLKVQVELGLSESLNESWYRSWALPRADGTRGFVPPEDRERGKKRRHLHEFHDEELHPSSKVPAQGLLEWKDVVAHSLHEQDAKCNELLIKLQDTVYESSTVIVPPFALRPKVLLETKKEQEERMHSVLANKAADMTAKNQTLLIVSHGGPVTHLYTRLTGNNWTEHGEPKYCCYSIYECDLDQEGDGEKVWKTLLVNQSEYLEELWSDATSNI